jgi:peptidoglycan hydrolase CwlO-like protein
VVPPMNIAQLVTALSSTGIFAVLASFMIKWRSLTHSAEKILRDHYATELDRLTHKIEEKDDHIFKIEKHLRDIIETADKRYEECQREREEDRERMRAMQFEIDGLKRQIPVASADKLLILGEKATPLTRGAAQRVKSIEGK